jgi:tetratricopeptide (TPR) repeat protein
MSQLLEILGRAITVDISDLILHWLNTIKLPADNGTGDSYRLLQIIELMGQNKLETATEKLRLYLFENPSCVYGRIAVASIFINNNQLKEAIVELNSVYMRQPTNTMALYALGFCYERLGKEAQAAEFYQDCLKFKSYLQLPAQRLAAIYFKNVQPEKTIRQYELISNEYPDDIPILAALGHLYIAVSDYEKAIDILNRAILMHPDNFQSENYDIDQLIAEGQLHEALEKIESLLETEPDRIDLIVKSADILRMLGATTDAVSQYEEAVRNCPDFLEATIKLGTQYLQTEQYELAARQFIKAIEINDVIVDEYISLSLAQKLSGNTRDAMGTLSLAAAIQPNSSMLFTETASLRFKTCLNSHSSYAYEDNSSDPVSSVIAAHCQQISEHNQNPDLHYRLGILMMSVGRIEEAIESFKAALKINPFFFRAKSKLVICLFDIGRNSEALENLTFTRCMEKDTLDLHYRISLLYCDKIKFASSMLNLERYLENNFTYPEASVNISVVLQNLGLLDRVSTMWDNLSETARYAVNS